MSYASVQAIREGAGLQSRSDNESPAGAVNGTNRAFTVKRRPIVDSDNDDSVSTQDVQAYVDGTAVKVASVDARGGIVTLQDAPTASSKVTLTYYFSPISDGYVEGKQKQADSWIDLKFRGAALTKPPTLPLKPVPGVITTAAELYAAGLILTRDWGARVDTEQTSKDGYAKIKLATQLLADYVGGLEAEERIDATNTTGNAQASAISDGDIFERRPDDGYVDPDDWFMRRQPL